MREVGVLEAKTRFSALLHEVEQGGDEVTITRNGRPVAVLKSLAHAQPQRRLSGPELTAMLKALHERYDDTEAEARKPLDLHKAMGRRD